MELLFFFLTNSCIIKNSPQPLRQSGVKDLIPFGFMIDGGADAGIKKHFLSGRGWE